MCSIRLVSRDHAVASFFSVILVHSSTTLLGITLIASHLLMTAPEEDAFWIFVQMMDTFLRPYFSPSSTQLDVDASLFAKALEASDAAVANKILNDLNVQPMHICRRW